ncbi:MAG: phosphotransferase [Lachnospiraceae bacterium]|nr:phosphotransferase [Lachnospiraceae bacterium]
MQEIQTTGGILRVEDLNFIYKVICEVFNCNKEQIINLEPLQKGLSNSVLTFELNGGKYVFRFPGLGSEILIDRGRESMIQSQANDARVDTTLVAMSVSDGWKIARYINNRGFDYKNVSDIVRGIRLIHKLHEAPVKVRYEFDVKSKWENIKEMTPEDQYGDNYSDFPEFSAIRDRVYKLYELAKKDGIPKCLTQGDSRDENFLINDSEIYLTDWEYAGYGDPGFDIGTYICGGDHSREEVDRVLFIYFGHEPNSIEKRHFYAWIAITGFFYMHWTMFKEASGQKIGYLKPLWYRFARDYSKLALEMYE